VAKRNTCFAQFFYRVNEDRTVEAICGFCFVASSPATQQAELREWEKAHLCLDRQHAPTRPEAGGYRETSRATPLAR
jgi:hypothetical protein